MFLLTSVQFLSSLQVIGESIRSSTLQADEIAPFGPDILAVSPRLIRTHRPLGSVPLCRASSRRAVIGSRRRVALFYFFAGSCFSSCRSENRRRSASSTSAADLGPVSKAVRFRFVTGFCTAMLTGLAIDALAGKLARRGVAAGVVGARSGWDDSGLSIGGSGAAFAVAGACGRRAARTAGRAGRLFAFVLAPSCAASEHAPLSGRRSTASRAGLFDRLQKRLTPQDRIQLAMPAHRVGIPGQDGLLFQIPAITDYETQVSQRYAEFSIMMRRGDFMSGINEVYFPGRGTRTR